MQVSVTLRIIKIYLRRSYILMADTKEMEIHKFEFIVLFSKIEKA